MKDEFQLAENMQTETNDGIELTHSPQDPGEIEEFDDLEGLEFLLEEIENKIAPLALA